MTIGNDVRAKVCDMWHMDPRSRSRSRLAITLGFLVYVSTVGAPASHAMGLREAPSAATSLVRSHDRFGDVQIVKRSPGLGARARHSIDLRRLTISRAGKIVRIAVTSRRIDRNDRFSQTWFVNFNPDNDSTTGQLRFSTHSGTIPPSDPDVGRSVFLVGTATPSEYKFCEDLAFEIKPGGRTWTMDVPRSCLPSGRVGLEVYSQVTQGPNAPELRQYSNDTLRVAGRHNVGGTVAFE